MNVEQLNHWAGIWAGGLWRATWQGSIFVAVVWLVCRYLKQLPPSFRFWLWWIGALQLLVRLVVLTPIAVPILPTHQLPPPQPVIQYEPEQAIVIPVQEPIELPPASPPPTPKPSSETVLLFAWVFGIGICAALGAKRMRATRRLLKTASPIEDPIALRLLLDLSAKSQLKPPPLLASPSAPCALVTGPLGPRIVLPKKEFSEEELRMAIAHEISHLRRRDLWLATIPAAAQTFLFFHPLSWLVAREAAAACEETCDLEALRLSGGSPAAYARLLLNSAQSGASLAAIGAAFRYRLLHRRITMLNSSKGPLTQHRRVGMLLIALGSVCALPWTVTAQSPKNVSHKKKKHTAHHAAPVAKAHNPVPRNVVPKPALAPVNPAPVARPLAATGASVPAAAAGLALAPRRISLTPFGVPPIATGPVPAGANSFRSLPPVTISGSGLSGFATTPAVAVPAAQSGGLAPSTAPRGQSFGGFGGGGQGGFGAAGAPASQGLGGGGFGGGGQSAGLGGGGFGVASAPAGPTFGGGGLTIMSQSAGLGGGESGSASLSFLRASSADSEHVTIHCRRADLIAAFSEIFDAAKVDFVLSPDVRSELITCSFNKATIHTAIDNILRSTRQKLTYEIEDNVYRIHLSNQSN